MTYKKNLFIGFTSISLVFAGNSLILEPALADKDDAIFEDNLTTTQGGAVGVARNSLSKKTVDIRESLVDTQLGKVTADRHIDGSDLDGKIFGRSSRPAPGRSAFISLWGSKIEGCFVEMIIQHAPAQGRVDPTAIIPTLLEVGVGGQLLQLPPQSSAKPEVYSQDYSYTSFFGKNTTSGTWYMTRNLFSVDSGIASILSQAPIKETRVRLTLSNGAKVLIPLDKKTVKNWKTAYSYNPTCKNLDADPAPAATKEPTSAQ
ncbi:hypothetical protein HRE53_17615 [Acaryochloris sp. 'Moss Beach']|uniref:hypothetical protein n=1 Tax=Acaryochloris sp. 'Moss Beach' TaxID=2740837 RepID=UPI001F47EF2E|nr:hypothetical protein [Acaryochloris sp. 'Moss Beach']UJB68358.1 hypothetical protein HRE53_17615 [Acaryochloris sp. 'Moss Beach']